MNKITDQEIITLLSTFDNKQLENFFSKYTYEQLKEYISSYIKVYETVKNTVESIFNDLRFWAILNYHDDLSWLE